MYRNQSGDKIARSSWLKAGSKTKERMINEKAEYLVHGKKNHFGYFREEMRPLSILAISVALSEAFSNESLSIQFRDLNRFKSVIDSYRDPLEMYKK